MTTSEPRGNVHSKSFCSSAHGSWLPMSRDIKWRNEGRKRRILDLGFIISGDSFNWTPQFLTLRTSWQIQKRQKTSMLLIISWTQKKMMAAQVIFGLLHLSFVSWQICGHLKKIISKNKRSLNWNNWVLGEINLDWVQNQGKVGSEIYCSGGWCHTNKYWNTTCECGRHYGLR